MEAAKRVRTVKKAGVTREYNVIHAAILNDKIDFVKERLPLLAQAHDELLNACDTYHDVLINITVPPDNFDDLVATSERYMSEVTDCYEFIVRKARDYLSTDNVDDADVKDEPNHVPPPAQPDPDTHVPEAASNLKSILGLMRLPKVEINQFDGSVANYRAFISQFEKSVESVTDDAQLRLNLLQQYCVGYAKELIKSCDLLKPKEGYKKARDLLYTRCGHPHKIAQQAINSLRHGKAVRTVKDLTSLSDELDGAIITLEQLGMLQEVATQAGIKDIVERVQLKGIKNRWRYVAMKILEEKESYPTLSDLCDYLLKQVRCLSDPVYGLEAFKDEPQGRATSNNVVESPTSRQPVSAPSSHMPASSSTPSRVVCPLCSEDHRLYSCPRFKELSAADRLDYVDKQKFCRVCMFRTHGRDKCKSRYKCRKCGEIHATVLHDALVANRSTSSTVSHLLSHNGSLLPCIPVVVNGSITTYALMDPGSTDSFCTQRLVNYMGEAAKTMDVNYSIETVNGAVSTRRSVVRGIPLASADRKESLQLRNVGVVESIPVYNAEINLASYAHLTDLKDLVTNQPINGHDQVDILIGQDHSEALLPLEVKSGSRGQPFAVRYLLGWALNGSLNPPTHVSQKVISNFVSTSASQEAQLDIDRLWNIDTDGLDDGSDSVWSVEDRLVMDLCGDKTQLKEGHYVVPIPFKPNIDMPDNYGVASCRLSNLKKSLRKRNLDERYRCEMQKLLDLGYAEEVSSDPTSDEVDPEVKIVSHAVHIPEVTSPMDALISRYSSYHQLCKAVAWLQKVRDKLCHKSDGEPALSVEDMERAEKSLLQHVQYVHYKSEIDALLEGKKLKKSSRISSLSPVMRDGLLCVRGRVSADHNLFPVIIPDCDLAQRILRDFHDRHHVGREWLLAILRERFWIVNCRALIKRLNCMKCRRTYGQPSQQLMADLPQDRVTPFTAPFTFCGIDVFGPFTIYMGRRAHKRYGCLFTCLVVRAIHIEVLDSLEADTFINAYVRFKSRRGTPRKLYSDNGTNFAAANKELAESLKKWNSDKKLAGVLLVDNVDWHFIPPSASNFGGAWERMIGVFRRVLKSVLTEDVHLDNEKLVTLFAEVEAVVNSRPLTKVSDDVKDPSFISPNSLLRPYEKSDQPLGVFRQDDRFSKRWRQVQNMADKFWHRWLKLYLPTLQAREKWDRVTRDYKVGDLVLLVDDNLPRPLWPLALVADVNVSRDGHIRSCRLKTKSRELVRPCNKLVLLEASV